jgi:hypothetical protein
VQGQLLDRKLSCTVETRCAVSGRTIELEIESDRSHHLRSSAERPMLVIPLIDLGALDAPSIVDDF